MARPLTIGNLVDDEPPFDRGFGRLLRRIQFTRLEASDCKLVQDRLAGATPAPGSVIATAVDELHADRFLSDATWHALDMTPAQKVELCCLVGLYDLVAMTKASFDRDAFVAPTVPSAESTRSLADPQWKLPTEPRLSHPGIRDIGILTWAFSKGVGLLNGAGSVDGVEMFSRSPRLFWSVVPFLLRLGPLKLGRTNGEIVTLRATWNVGSHYHWGHHGFAGRLAGLSRDQIDHVADGPDWPGWNEEQAALLRAVDDLHRDRRIGDKTWSRLHEFFDDAQIAEVCFITGNYEMLCMALNSFGIRFEDGAWDRGVTRHLLRLRRSRP